MNPAMKNWIILFCLLRSLQSVGQEPTIELEFSVIKETLPQVLDANPNSIASLLKGSEGYETLNRMLTDVEKMDDTITTGKLRSELNQLSDSISKILENTHIFVLLSDTLYTYDYSPSYEEYTDGWVDTFDLRDSSTWQIKYEDLVEVFQTDHRFRGLSTPIDLEFADLIKAHINASPAIGIPIDLNDLSSLNYTSIPPANQDSLSKRGLLINGIRLYKPVFNKSLNKACYLFSYQAGFGPWREFIFIEKRNEKWYFLESYGSELIDGNEEWFK